MTDAPQDLQSQISLTSPGVIRKLRGIVSPHGKKGLWLRHLSDPRLAEVYHRLRLGQSVHSIVVLSQKDWGIMKDSNVKSMSRAMAKFRDAILDDLQLDSVKTPANRPENRARKRRATYLVKKLDGLGVLRWSIAKQAERLQTCLNMEEQEATPLRGTNETVKTLGTLIDTYMKYQVELGLLEVKPMEFNINIKTKFDKLIGAGAVTDDGARLAAATHRFLELAESSAVLMEVDECGTYTAKEVPDEST